MASFYYKNVFTGKKKTQNKEVKKKYILAMHDPKSYFPEITS